MKLDRNIPELKRGKYALIKLREPDAITECDVFTGQRLVRDAAIDFGNTPDTDFFVIRLKDKYAATALRSYAYAAMADDHEYGNEVMELAKLAANHPSKRMPD